MGWRSLDQLPRAGAWGSDLFDRRARGALCWVLPVSAWGALQGGELAVVQPQDPATGAHPSHPPARA